MTRTHHSRFGLTAAAVALAAAAPAADAPPPVGTVQTIPVVTVSLAVGSTDKEAKRVVYSPPPGWYIRSHKVEAANRSGLASYAVNTLPAGWDWKTADSSSEGARAKAAGTVSAYKVAVGGSAEGEQARAAESRQAHRASHHVIVVDVTARGGGLLGSGATIDLTVTAELVYLGVSGR